MQKRKLTGIVVSDKPDQTVVVKVERRVVHPIYRKAYFVSKRFAAHDADNAFKVGQEVTIEETRPLSATKRFRVLTDETPTKAATKTAKPAAATKEKA